MHVIIATIKSKFFYIIFDFLEFIHHSENPQINYKYLSNLNLKTFTGLNKGRLILIINNLVINS